MEDEYSIELFPGTMLVEPLRNSDLIRKEKTYERHTIARVWKSKKVMSLIEAESTIEPGKTLVAYDDSNAIGANLMVAGEKRNVEFIRMESVYAVLTQKEK